MSKPKSVTITYACPNCGQENSFDVRPPRPPPPCSNPDSPAFSDPGDPSDVDGPEECIECGYAFDDSDHETIISRASDV